MLTSFPKTHKTRFSELGYWMVEPGCWQCVDLTGENPRQTGAQYATKAELLANLEAYATEYGCENANPKPDRHMENALRSIAALWPEPGMCAEIAPEWVGPNDGKMRADILFYALNTARKALGLPTYPEPDHWKKEV